ncbi:MAG: hypothetical protein UR26_C0004G0004 [candidate division TM6 bacterium GW2011_GWF2_32_72]|nr:MAG: hypothetical protein UR26_C0004G0004 [candidate division TM6 bacterium GW2011_GWF2_32_72]
MKKKLIILNLIIVAALVARERSISSAKRFSNDINKYDMSVVCFYQYDKATKQDESLKQQVKQMLDMFDELSKKTNYKRAGVIFLKCNIDDPEWVALANSYGVVDFTKPTFFLFRGGSPVKDNLVGFVSRKALEELIDDNWGSRIDDIIEAKNKEEMRKAEQAALYGAAWGPYYDGYWGWPYAGYGIGFGWGGGYYGGRRGYYHGGYRGGHRGGYHGGGHRGRR